uniref:cytokine receptor common subunit beta isoform X2 n=1 Tax=Monopterus albus TaxID=43700 RepID=UPI0009B2F045|nr:interleukin-3 receptor class 2 subunit beta-like isoform X2 [Monopterus albus]
MPPFFWAVLWSAILPLALSGPDRCNVSVSSSARVAASPLLKSLQCHNDYYSFIHCSWRELTNTRLQLWLQTENRSLCKPYSPPGPGEPGIAHCRFEASVFAVGSQHTVFFLKEEPVTICSSAPHKPLHLSQLLRARTPVALSSRDAGDGGRLLSWSSPYPSSSALNKNLTYQLSYKTDRHDKWTTEDIMNTSVKLEKQLLLPGHRYEAKVRARVSVGQWSEWSPMVTWQTEQDTGQFPNLHCVLDGETVVICSWEVSRELDHFIAYQLACRSQPAAKPEICCKKPNVNSDPGGPMVKYNCSLPVADPAQLLELIPTHSAKSFEAYHRIRPTPPLQVKVTEKGSNWVVKWIAPPIASEVELSYQGSSKLLNISLGSTSLTILGMSLAPSQHYQVKVRALVSERSLYKGIPSEWTNPVDWTSHAATWSFTTLIYVFTGLFVGSVFLILYCTIPACKRRVYLWVDSIPSPSKSKILSEFKFTISQTLIQSEDTSSCKVLRFDSISTCTSDSSLWSTKDTDQKCLEQEKGNWICDNLPTFSEKVKTLDRTSVNFSGPYIFCQASESKHTPVGIQCEDKEKEENISPSDSLSPVHVGLYRDDYMCLPGPPMSRSTQDLVSHGDASTNTHSHHIAELDQQCPDTTPWPEKPGLGDPTARDQPPAYTCGPFTSWPQGGNIHASGYCHLPPS